MLTNRSQCYLFLHVCTISNQSTSKKSHHVSDLSKLDALLHKTHIKALRIDMCTSMISLNKIAHQMWHDCTFSQRNKTTERAVIVGVGGDRGGSGRGGGVGKI